jgi:hypothetical protein
VALLFYYIFFVFISVYLFYFICIMRTRCSEGSPKGLVAMLFYFILNKFILVYFNNTHQVLVGHPQGVGGLAVL